MAGRGAPQSPRRAPPRPPPPIGTGPPVRLVPSFTVIGRSVVVRHRDARHAQRGRLLLDAARVGDDCRGVRHEAKELEVPERVDQQKSSARTARTASASSMPDRVRGCAGNTTGISSESSDSAPRRSASRAPLSTLLGRCRVASTKGPARNAKTAAGDFDGRLGDRQKPSQGVDHRVAHANHAPRGETLGREIRRPRPHTS